jgi:hypothetical protein
MFKKTLLLISALLLTLQAGAAAADDQFDLKSHAGKGAETFLGAQDVSYWCDRG